MNSCVWEILRLGLDSRLPRKNHNCALRSHRLVKNDHWTYFVTTKQRIFNLSPKNYFLSCSNSSEGWFVRLLRAGRYVFARIIMSAKLICYRTCTDCIKRCAYLDRQPPKLPHLILHHLTRNAPRLILGVRQSRAKYHQADNEIA